MAKYRVIEYFTDLQDSNFPYNVGDTFPRSGKTVTADRIKELSGTSNLRGIALIEEVREIAAEAKADESPAEDEPRKRTRKRKTEE